MSTAAKCFLLAVFCVLFVVTEPGEIDRFLSRAWVIPAFYVLYELTFYKYVLPKTEKELRENASKYNRPAPTPDEVQDAAGSSMFFGIIGIVILLSIVWWVLSGFSLGTGGISGRYGDALM